MIIHKWINYKNKQGSTALHYASYKGNLDIIILLIDNGADPEAVNNRGLNMLHFAAQGNQVNSLVYFKEKYSLDVHSMDDLGSTVLHWACYISGEIAVEFILSWQVDIDHADKEGITALHLAVDSGNLAILKKLLIYGANKDIRDKKGRTPFQIAFDKKKNDIVKIFTENLKCQLCAFKQPLYKVEKSNFNVVFFILLHFVIELCCFFLLVPCKYFKI